MKKTLATIAILIFSIPCLVMASGNNLLAQVQLNPDLKPQYAAGIETKDKTPTSTANYILQMLAGSLIYLAGPLGITFLAYGGLRYVTSHGDQTQMETAKKTITYAIVGLIVIVFSWAIVVNVITIIENVAKQT